MYCPSFCIVKVMLSEAPLWIATCGLSNDRVIGLLAEAFPIIGAMLANTIKQTNKLAFDALFDIRPSQSRETTFLSESEIWTNFG